MAENDQVDDKTGEVAEPTAEEAVAEVAAEVAPSVEPAQVERVVETILLENGSRINRASGYEGNQWRVADVSGHNYDHCSDDPSTGEWVYRVSK